MSIQQNPTPRDTTATPSTELAYEVYVSDPASSSELLPNGEPKSFSPIASTLVYGRDDAVLTDPGFLADHAQALGDWVATKGRNVTDIVITHGHGDHWFAAQLLAERFGARIVATADAITQMHAGLASRPLIWDRLYPGIPPTSVTAVTVPDNRLTLEGHELVLVEVGHSDSDGTSVLHVPDLGLVVAGDVIYNGAHQYLGEGVLVGGFDPWRAAIDKVEALQPRHIVAGHQRKERDDDAARTIAATRRYLDDADEFLQTEPTALDFFTAMVGRYPEYLGHTILWVGASALYGVRERPEANLRQILLAAWQ